MGTTLNAFLRLAGNPTLNGLIAGGDSTRPVVVPSVSRSHLPKLCGDLGFTKGAEIGVWKGAFSAAFCAAAPFMHMLCVDSWSRYEGWEDGKSANEAHIEEAFQIAGKVLLGKNATITRAFSQDAAQAVPDRSLDFVYIDGNHLYNPVLSDLSAWAAKVRPGEIVAGHDYRIFPNKPYIQVVAAVRAYTTYHEIDPWFVLAADRTPSFLWVKS